MTPTITPLKNGITICTEKIDQSQSALIAVGFLAGSLYETKDTNGIAHFIEHMFFKGGKKYPTYKDVSNNFDSIGAESNAFTSKEYVCYYSKTAHEYIDTSFDILSDMILESVFDKKEIEKERGVIIEEINMYEDHPQSKISQVFDKNFYGDNPLGWDIIGPKKNILKFTRDDLIAFKNDFYHAGNMVIVALGNVQHEDIVAKTKKYFPSIPKAKPLTTPSENIPTLQATSTTITKPIEQSHIIIGYPTQGKKGDDRYAIKLLSIILGGNMSSRLFSKIREEMGACYSIYTSYHAYNTIGEFTCQTGLDVAKKDEVIEEIHIIFNEVHKNGVTKEELTKAQSYMSGKLALYFEDAENRGFDYLKKLLQGEEIIDLKERIEEYKNVTLDQVNMSAKKLFAKKPTIAVLTPSSIDQ